jgi:putative ABC transport system substrate-binding protein
MRRRELMALIGGAAAAWPLGVHAQQPALPVIGFLSARSADGDAHLVAAFRRGLGEAGLVERNNVTIEFRWADGHSDRLHALVRDLIAHGVAMIVAAGGISSVAAAEATSTIPIVFISTSDPMENRVVLRLDRPGGDSTGISLTAVALAPKRIELLLELLPQAKDVALLVNPTTATTTPPELRDVLAAAREHGWTVHTVNAAGEGDFEQAFATMARESVDGLIVGTDPLFVKARDRLVELATRRAIPAIYDRREFVEAGGLMSYGSNISEGYRRGGVYAARILKGVKPADLPVEQAAIFEFVINLRTAKALGLSIAPSLLARADEVLE